MATLVTLLACSQFLIAQVMPGKEYYIREMSYPSPYLAISAGGSGAKAAFTSTRTGARTKWQFIHLGNNVYQIKNASTGFFLGNGMNSSQSLLFGFSAPGEGAKWKIEPNKDQEDDREWFSIKSAHSDLYVANNASNEGMQKSYSQAGVFTFELVPPTFFVKTQDNEYYYSVNHADGSLSWKSTFDNYYGRGSDGCSGPALGEDYSFRFFYSCRDHDVCYSAPWQAAGLDGYAICNKVQFEQNKAYCNEMYPKGAPLHTACMTNAGAMMTGVSTVWAKNAYQDGQNYANSQVGKGAMTVTSPNANLNKDYIINLKNNAAFTVRMQVRYLANDGQTITTYWSKNILAAGFGEVIVPYGARNLVLVIEKIAPLPKKTIEKSIRGESQGFTLSGAVLSLDKLQ